MSDLKPIPKFANEDEEREFWQTHDSTEYVDWSKAKPSYMLDIEKLREDPQFQVLLHNLYIQAESCARSPFSKERGFKDFKEIAELDMLMYLRQSKQIDWKP